MFSVVFFGVYRAEAQTTVVGGFRRAGTNAQIKAMQRQRLKDSLGLTEDQSKNVDAIQQNYMLKMRAVKMDTQIGEDERKTKLRELQEQRVGELKQVISEDQIAKMDNRQKQLKKVKRQSKGKYYHKKKKMNDKKEVAS